MGCGASTSAPPETDAATAAKEFQSIVAAPDTSMPKRRGSTGGKRHSIVGQLPTLRKKAQPSTEPIAKVALPSDVEAPFQENTAAKEKYVDPIQAVPRRSSLSLPKNKKAPLIGGASGGSAPDQSPRVLGGSNSRRGTGPRSSRGISISEEEEFQEGAPTMAGLIEEGDEEEGEEDEAAAAPPPLVEESEEEMAAAAEAEATAEAEMAAEAEAPAAEPEAEAAEPEAPAAEPEAPAAAEACGE